MADLQREMNCVFLHSIPYQSQMNGVIERFMRVLGRYLAVLLLGVDHRLHCYCAEFIVCCWNAVEKRNYPRHHSPEKVKGLSPRKILQLEFPAAVVEGPPLARLRRFGCLVFFHQEPYGDIRKLQEKWRRGVFLGYAKANSGFLVGCWIPHEGRSTGYAWSDYEVKDVRFREDILIKDIDWLLPNATKGVFLPWNEIDRLVAGEDRSGDQDRHVVGDDRLGDQEEDKPDAERTPNGPERLRLLPDNDDDVVQGGSIGWFRYGRSTSCNHVVGRSGSGVHHLVVQTGLVSSVVGR